MSELRRALTFWQATMFGIGLILGAGIYVVIGRTAAYAGDAVWLSVLVAGLVAFLTGLSYAELAGMYPRASSSYFYVRRAMPGREDLAFLVGWMIFFEAASGAATAAVGFAKYFLELVPQLRGAGGVGVTITSVALIAIMSLVNWWGIRESSALNVAFTLVELSGLVMVVVAGFALGTAAPNYASLPPGGVLDILRGAALIFFAYVGFELMATTSEETVEARVVMPRAILAALGVCGVIYLLVALAVVRLIPGDELAAAEAPLAAAVERAVGTGGWYLLATIALFATSNTVLGFLVSSSRMAYGMSADGMLHRALSAVHPKRRTPHNAVALAGGVAAFEIVAASLSGGAVIDVVAKSSNLGCLIAFIFVNASVVLLRLRRPQAERPFKIPVSVAGVPVAPVLANALCALVILLTFHEAVVWLITLAILGLGAAIRRASKL